MRDKRFIAVHRGGLLSIERHRMILRWSCDCAEHLIRLIPTADIKLLKAVETGRLWADGKVKTGEAMKASVDAIKAANEAASNGVSMAVSRAVGHAVATAHMADHCVGVVLYGLRAVRLAGENVEAEREWQLNRLPDEIRLMVIELLSEKEKHFRI